MKQGDVRVVWVLVVLLACALVGCAKPCPATAAATPAHPATGATLPGRLPPDSEQVAQAEFEVTRLDAEQADWSIYAHHPNPYVRALALERLRDRATAASDEQLSRVAALLFDAHPIRSTECIGLLESAEQGQGLDLARGECVENQRTVATLAGEVLDQVEPKRVVTAIVASLAEPGLRELMGYTHPAQTVLDRLRAAAANAPGVLDQEVARWLPKARPDGRQALLAALAVAPPGSGDESLIAALVPLLKSDDRREALLAAAAVLRLTDGAGPQAPPVTSEPRQSAARLLATDLGERSSLSVLESIGPAGAALLDPVLERLEKSMSQRYHEHEVAQYAEVIAAMGPRAKRASPTLFRAARAIAASEHPGHLHTLVHALGDIQAPGGELTQLVLAHLDDRIMVGAATQALLNVKAELSPADLTRLEQGMREYCTIPNHPRAFDGSWDVCFQALDDFEKLKKIAKGSSAAEPGGG